MLGCSILDDFRVLERQKNVVDIESYSHLIMYTSIKSKILSLFIVDQAFGFNCSDPALLVLWHRLQYLSCTAVKIVFFSIKVRISAPGFT